MFVFRCQPWCMERSSCGTPVPSCYNFDLQKKLKFIKNNPLSWTFFFVSAKTKSATLSATMSNSMSAIFVMVADMEVDKVADIVAGLRIFFKSLKALQVNF